MGRLKKENENLQKINEDQEILIEEQMTTLNEKENKIATFITEHNLEIDCIKKETEAKNEKFEERMKKEIQEIKSKDGNKFELLLEGEKRRVKDILEIQNKHKIELKSKDDEIEKLKESHKNELSQKETEISNFKTKHKAEIEEI